MIQNRYWGLEFNKKEAEIRQLKQVHKCWVTLVWGPEFIIAVSWRPLETTWQVQLLIA